MANTNIDCARLKALISEKGLSQKYVCEQIGKRRTFISEVALGKDYFSINEVNAVADLLNTTADYLIGLSDQKEKAHLNEGELSETEFAVLKAFRSLNEENQRLFLEFLAKL